MMQTVTLIAALLLGVAFGWAALAKLAGSTRWRGALEGYRLPPRVERASVWAAPAAEALVVILLAANLQAGAAAATALLATFSLVIVRTRSLGSGDKLPCGCFGSTETRDYRVLLVRNATLGALAALILVAGERAGLAQQVRVRGGDAVPMLLVVLAALLISWTAVSTVASFKSGRRS